MALFKKKKKKKSIKDVFKSKKKKSTKSPSTKVKKKKSRKREVAENVAFAVGLGVTRGLILRKAEEMARGKKKKKKSKRSGKAVFQTQVEGKVDKRAKGSGGRWVTIRGRRVFIPEGQ